ncbi:MAG TPA: hypothetical protein VF678_15240, partial [bacterium]
MPDIAVALNRMLDRVASFLLTMSFPKFVGLVLTAAVLRNGLWVIPNFSLHRLAATNPFVNPIPDDPLGHYVLYSPLAHLIAHAAHMYGSRALFLAYHGLLTFGGMVALLYLTRRLQGDAAARWLGVAFVALPISGDLLMWLGNVDIYTFLLMTLLVLVRNPALACALAVALGFNHFEQGLLAAGSVSVFQWLVQERSRVAIVLQMLGVLAGKALLSFWFIATGMQVSEGRILHVITRGFGVLANGLLTFQAAAGSAFSALWPVMIVAVWELWRQNRKAGMWTVAALAALVVPGMFIALDTSRVYAMITWPLVFALLLWTVSVPFSKDPLLSQRLLAITAISCILVPQLMVW